jgi:hypothetical protein
VGSAFAGAVSVDYHSVQGACDIFVKAPPKSSVQLDSCVSFGGLEAPCMTMDKFDIPIPEEIGQSAKESHNFNLQQVHSVTAHLFTKDGKGQPVIRGDGAKPVYSFYLTHKSVIVTRVTGKLSVQKSYVRLVVLSSPKKIEDTWSIGLDSNYTMDDTKDEEETPDEDESNSTSTNSSTENSTVVATFDYKFSKPNVTAGPMTSYMADSALNHTVLLNEVVPVRNFTKPAPKNTLTGCAASVLCTTTADLTNFALRQIRCVSAVAAHVLFAGRSTTNSTATIKSATAKRNSAALFLESNSSSAVGYDACAADQLADIHAKVDGFERQRVQKIVEETRRRVRSFVMTLDSLDPSVRTRVPCPAKGCDNLSDDL